MPTITVKLREDNQNLKYSSYIVCIPKTFVKIYSLQKGDMLTIQLLGKLDAKNGIYTKFENE